ncbi:NAD(P)/FAD-dependent oxidoreductase [Noviherbaspirillum sedimenti]|uniref:NAD(P)/FAD-dependent oxidoreductase n=1 Tax=Noviherbaspirillum sedimenti TaxID=2320865 RepID=A0A3A3G170_9BURK|nr:FAD-dependent oxidoreductase [Noviherbaspirillum sedimenti]RJG00659.1 NAD(P)/FAD-dependent oxidoreductase [Noviherbaspirillum sedimenti]
MDTYDVLVVGAGHGGAQIVASLRQQGFKGSIGMIGDEVDAPYERPPLSKAYLAGETSVDQLLLRPQAFWIEQEIALKTGLRVTSVDAQAHQVRCASGEQFGYRHLVWATGGQPRRLVCKGSDLAGIHVVRTRAQVDAMRDEVVHAKNVVIIGGGYIGLETAAILAKAGKSVCVIEAQDRVLARVTSPVVSAFYEEEHRRHGVRILTKTSIESLLGDKGRIAGVLLSNGEVLPADMAVVGIGLIPEVSALMDAGAVCTNGVDIDAQCRTTLLDVYALGDCVNYVNAFADGARVRLESVQNANDQAKVVATNIIGIAQASYSAVPWFWSNQYDLKLQTVGLNIGYDQTVVRGNPDNRSFSVVYLRKGKIIALDCINAARDFVFGKKLVAQGVVATAAQLEDVHVDLNSLAASAASATVGVL